MAGFRCFRGKVERDSYKNLVLQVISMPSPRFNCFRSIFLEVVQVSHKRGIKNESFARWKLFVNAWLLHRALGVLLISKRRTAEQPLERTSPMEYPTGMGDVKGKTNG